MVLPTKEDNMYDDFDSPYVDHCYVCGGVDQCDEVAHDMASEEPYAYDEEPIYDPWQDERYTFMTTGAPF